MKRWGLLLAVMLLGMAPSAFARAPRLAVKDAREWARVAIATDIEDGFASRGQIDRCDRLRRWKVVCYYREWNAPLSIIPGPLWRCKLAPNDLYAVVDFYMVTRMRKRYDEQGMYWIDEPNEAALASCPWAYGPSTMSAYH